MKKFRNKKNDNVSQHRRFPKYSIKSDKSSYGSISPINRTDKTPPYRNRKKTQKMDIDIKSY
jgi:hypothetical protein